MKLAIAMLLAYVPFFVIMFLELRKESKNLEDPRHGVKKH